MGIADIALGAAPIAGGLLVGSVAGGLKPTDYRAAIKADLDILDRLPDDDTELRDSLYRSISMRVNSLVAGVDRSISLKQAAAAYQGHWRDAVSFLCAVLFTVVWWHVDHHRSNWKPMFALMVVACIVTAVYAVRGVVTGIRNRGGARAPARPTPPFDDAGGPSRGPGAPAGDRADWRAGGIGPSQGAHPDPRGGALAGPGPYPGPPGGPRPGTGPGPYPGSGSSQVPDPITGPFSAAREGQHRA